MCATTSIAATPHREVKCTETKSEREEVGEQQVATWVDAQELAAQSPEASQAEKNPDSSPSRCTTGDLSFHWDWKEATQSPRTSPCEKSPATASVPSTPCFNHEHVSRIVDSPSSLSNNHVNVNDSTSDNQYHDRYHASEEANCKKRKRDEHCDFANEDHTDGEDAENGCSEPGSSGYSGDCCGSSPSSPSSAALPPPRKRSRRTLYIEYWSRTDECKERKWDHLDEIADKYGCPEDHIFDTVLKNRTSFLEPNMFPYDTPPGIEHWTLWHVKELCHEEIKEYVEEWIDTNARHVRRWNYDDNPERSIDIFHVHVYFQVAEGDSVLRDRKVEDLVHGNTIVPTPYADALSVTAFR